MNLKGSRTEKNLKDAFAGESQANRRYLYFAAKADVEELQRDVSAVFPLDRRRRQDRACAWPSRVSRGGRRSRDRIADRSDRRQPEGGDRRRDARVHTDMYPGMAKAAREEELRPEIVRPGSETTGQGRALARQPLPESARRAVAIRARHPSRDGCCREFPRSPNDESAAPAGRPRGQPRGADAPSDRVEGARVPRRDGTVQRARAGVRDLPRLPPRCFQPLPILSDAI